MTRTALILAAVLLPAACSHVPTDQQLAADCKAAGYSTEGYIACLSSSIDGAAIQRTRAAAQRARAFEVLGAMGERISQGSAAYARPQITCRQVTWGVICN